MNKRIAALALAATVALCWTVVGYGRKSGAGTPRPGSPFLFVWSGDAARTSSDFLAVIDANPDSPSYARIVQTLPVEAKGTMPHHTEYEFPAGNVLFANGWAGRRSFLFDLSQPLHPRLIGQFEGRAGYGFLHSFARLQNGNVLATFQSHGEGYTPGGGLVELKQDGSAVRATSAVDPGVDKDLIWPYSLVVVPKADRVVSTSTVMGWPDWKELPAGSWPREKINAKDTSQVQLWRFSDLHLLKTVTLPKDSGHHDEDPAEPRLLSGGSVYVNTFRCGLFLLKGMDGAQPSAQMVYSFPGGTDMHSMCAVPVVIGHYWIQTVGALPGLIALDVSHPEKPIEVSRLTFDKQFTMPHWLAADRKGDRLVVTGDEGSWVLVARFDVEKGKLTLDETFREAGSAVPGINFDREQWPHGKTGRAIVHGTLFGPN